MLKISEKLSLPDDAVTEVMAWIGRRGSGKTYGATKACEEMHRIGAQFVALDAVGVWYGLRLAPDQKSAGLNIPIFGGLHGDLPISATSGGVIADTIVDHSLSAIIDTSQFEADADKNRFVYDFASRFFFRKKASPSAVHVFIEESQEYIPQNLQKGEERMLHAMQRMIRLGRNYGIGASLITQRPQDVSKKALNQAEIVFAFQLVGPQELDAVAYWCKAKGYGEDLKTILPALQTGNAHVWSPALLKVNKEIRISAKTTFAAGSTPKIGAKPVRTKPLEPVEIEALKSKMAATIEQQKADDPKELRRQLAERDKTIRELQKRPDAPVINVETERKKAALAATREQWLAFKRSADELVALMTGAAVDYVKRLEPILLGEPIVEAALVAVSGANGSLAAHRAAPAKVPPKTTVKRETFSGPGDAGLSPADRKILTVLAQYPQRSRKQVAILTGYSYNSGGFNGTLGNLGKRGYLTSAAGNLVITQPGLEALGSFEPLPIGDELRQMWLQQLEAAESKILGVLSDRYPEALTRQQIAEAAGYSYNTGGFNGALGKLGKLELIEQPAKGQIRASAELFG